MHNQLIDLLINENCIRNNSALESHYLETLRIGLLTFPFNGFIDVAAGLCELFFNPVEPPGACNKCFEPAFASS